MGHILDMPYYLLPSHALHTVYFFVTLCIVKGIFCRTNRLFFCIAASIWGIFLKCHTTYCLLMRYKLWSFLCYTVYNEGHFLEKKSAFILDCGFYMGHIPEMPYYLLPSHALQTV
jgi:hypothetical protein